MTQTNLVKIKGNWEEVVDNCRFTVGKGSLHSEPSTKFKKEILISEHSPVRSISVVWDWLKIPHWVVVHWVRHKWEKFVATQRTDRTGIDRRKLPQDSPSDIRCEANVQHLIDTWRKRLCFQASAETRELAEDYKKTLHTCEPEISDVLVPNCIYRGGCPELPNMNRCKFYENFKNKLNAKGIDIGNLTIQERYDEYNLYFYNKSEE